MLLPWEEMCRRSMSGRATTVLLYWQIKDTNKLIISIVAKVPPKIRLLSVVDAVHITGDIPKLQFQVLSHMHLQVQ